ncbi:Asp-tRNAAsn/Glu-tRNAGln amidotransferase A subunit [Halopelagius inordinatus]|uniref:Asp-tRNAAsn/Glu-tRNAGln amidotransferase A subunit n=1 Tax=Halopelagius inordinatus TaxID=553467 RepID=A0A1I2T1L0_9EURY|nr:amidase family protein [Halopelagius inordinatus]SFG58813.1 Asp-tRNAAsn/Glu-tRNAGln amidotransferase A subunit [Halopelagius inordinatus]
MYGGDVDDETQKTPVDSARLSTSRRSVLKSVGILGGAGLLSGIGSAESSGGTSERTSKFDPREATAAEIRELYRTNQTTVTDVVERYLERIRAYEEELGAIIRVNPHVMDRAAELDAALESNELVGPLHGVPVLLKDNNDTADIPTTAGSVSMKESTPPDDATIVSWIRDAGGIVLAKTNLHEFAFGYDTVSSLGGVTHNPYDTDRYAGGSSGGTGAGIAASLGVLGTGTDTGGSVRVPAAATGLVGLRPSTGLVSRDGIVPLALTEDTAGPMTRTVADAAVFTDALVGYDPADPETAESVGRTPHAEGGSYTDYLNEDGLDGARIGVYRDYVGPTEEEVDEADEAVVEDAKAVTAVFDDALADLERAGATVVDPVEAPSWEFVYEANVSSSDEFNRDIDAYLEGRGDDTPDSLEAIVESDEYAPAICESIREREEVDEDALDENVDYLRGLSKRDDLQEFVLGTMAEHDLDAIVYPALRHTPPHIDSDEPWGSNAQLTPALEFPSMTVPAGLTEGSSMPVGIEFVAREYREERLFELGYAYEQESNQRRPPEGFGPVDASGEDWSAERIDSWNEAQHEEQTVARLGCGDGQ